MPARSHRRSRSLLARGAWIAAAVALALVVGVLATRGPDGSRAEGRALGPAEEAPPAALAPRGAALDLQSAAPSDAARTGALEPDGDRRARAAAPVANTTPIVVGFGISDELRESPLSALGAMLGFELAKGKEQWSGRQLAGHRWRDAQVAFGNTPEISLEHALSSEHQLLCFEVDPATPRGVPVAFAVQLTFGAPRSATYRGKGTLTLTGAPYQRLPDVPCRRVDAWAAGAVIAGRHIDLRGALVELIEVPGINAAAASAEVRSDRSFSVPAPARSTPSLLRLRVVLAGGHSFPPQGSYEAFTEGIVLHVEASRTATGRLLFRGAPATGLARLHAEEAGAKVGQVILERDGAFTLSGLPFGAFDIVIESARPGGELTRFPLASLVGDTSARSLDLGALEVSGHAAVMELELVDRTGAPAAAQLRWRGRGGSGGASLRAAAVHTLLLAAVVPFDMELVSLTQAAPIALAARAGRVRVVVGE